MTAELLRELALWGLGILTTLFGGLNIFQWLTFRSYKRKANSEADKSEIDALRDIISGMQAEIDRLQKRVDDADARSVRIGDKYNGLIEDYYKLKNEFEQYKIEHK